MGRPARWGAVVVATAVMFGVCFALAKEDPFGWLPEKDAGAFAGAVAAAVVACGSWWAGGSDRPRRSVVIRGEADRRGEVLQRGWGAGEENVDLNGRADRGARVVQDREDSGSATPPDRSGQGGA